MDGEEERRVPSLPLLVCIYAQMLVTVICEITSDVICMCV